MKWMPIINYKAETIGHFHECEGMVCFRFMDGRRRVFKSREAMYYCLEEGIDLGKIGNLIRV